MKKYLLGFVAVFLAIAFTSFKNLSPITFQYNPPGGTSYANNDVKNLDHWSASSLVCSGADQVACTISVPVENTINDAGFELDPALVTIATSEFATNKYKVVAGTGYSSPDNRPAP